MAFMPIIDRINRSLSEFADGQKIRYLNINDKLADGDGRLFDGMMNAKDKLHPTVKAYQVWADALKPILTELLGPPAAVDHAPPPTGDSPFFLLWDFISVNWICLSFSSVAFALIDGNGPTQSKTRLGGPPEPPPSAIPPSVAAPTQPLGLQGQELPSTKRRAPRLPVEPSGCAAR